MRFLGLFILFALVCAVFSLPLTESDIQADPEPGLGGLVNVGGKLIKRIPWKNIGKGAAKGAAKGAVKGAINGASTKKNNKKNKKKKH